MQRSKTRSREFFVSLFKAGVYLNLNEIIRGSKKG